MRIYKIFLFTIVLISAVSVAFMPFLSAQNSFTEFKADNYSLYVDTERVNSVVFTTDSSHLDVAQLTIKILPSDDFIGFINLPDGGNMLINTGSPANEEKVVEAVSKEITEMSMEYDMMKLFGWKSRIDWLVLTSDLPTNIGGFSLISKSFEIKELITPSQTILSRLTKINQIKITGDKKIDLLQVISPVSLDINGLNKDRFSKDCLILKYSYLGYSFSFLLGLAPEDVGKIAKEYPQFIDSTVIFTNIAMSEEIISKVKALFIVAQTQDIEFVTDGKLMFVQVPEQIKNNFYDIILQQKH